MAWTHDQMAARAARELKNGDYINLGIGLPTQVTQHVPEGMQIWLQSENGLIGIGPPPYEDEVDPHLLIRYWGGSIRRADAAYLHRRLSCFRFLPNASRS
jgi:3-oxoacid CoA-transferase B subunit